MLCHQFSGNSVWLLVTHKSVHTKCGVIGNIIVAKQRVELTITLQCLFTKSLICQAFQLTHWDQIMHQWMSSLVKVMVYRRLGDKPLPKPVLTYGQLDNWAKFQWYLKENNTTILFSFKEMNVEMLSAKLWSFCSASMRQKYNSPIEQHRFLLNSWRHWLMNPS